jgi:hypothetical protein
MKGIPFFLIALLLIAYVIGARWPMLAQKIGVA